MHTVFVIGSAIPEITGDLSSFPQPGGDVTLSNMHESVGGCAMNILCDMHAHGLAPQALLPIGSGMWGEFTERDVTARGINNRAASVRGGQPHGFCITLVDSTGERTFLTSDTAQAVFTEELLENVHIPEGSYVYASGYELVSETGAVLARWLRKCYEEAPFHLVLDPGPLAVEVGRGIFVGLADIAEGITANEGEAQAIFAGDVSGSAGIESWVRAGLNLDRWVLVRSAESACLYRWAGEEVVASTIPFTRSDALVNTSGAGDAHTAGLLAGLAGGMTLEQAVAQGHAWARSVVERSDPHL